MKILFVTFALLVCCIAKAQQNQRVKLYAYVQPVTPGTQKARDIDESGNRLPAKENGLLYNYWFYAVSASPARLYPVELWLKGKKYGVKFHPIAKAPVTQTINRSSGTTKTVVLVPQTSGKVLQLLPMDAISGKHFPKAEKLAATNEVVFVYRQNGEFGYQTLPKLSVLEVAAMQ